MNTLSIIKEKIKKIELFLETIENDNISRIEKDILLEKLRSLYDFIIYDSDIPETLTKIDQKITSSHNDNKQKNINYSAQENVDIQFSDIEFTKKSEFSSNQITESKKNEPIIEVKKEEPIKSEKKTEIKQNTLFGNEETQQKTLGETLGKDKTSINEIIGQNKKQTDVISKLNLKPINDIKTSIGIGDRFLYIRELFNGDKDLFDTAVSKLNNFENFDQAIEYLKSNFNWDFEDEIADSFLTIVRRKYL